MSVHTDLGCVQSQPHDCTQSATFRLFNQDYML